MTDQIYFQLEDRMKVTNEAGDYDVLTCVEATNGCYGCFFKREKGKPQNPFCNAVVCGDFERMDGKDVIFQNIKTK